MDICQYCNVSVFARSDGTCPNCQENTGISREISSDTVVNKSVTETDPAITEQRHADKPTDKYLPAQQDKTAKLMKKFNKVSRRSWVLTSLGFILFLLGLFLWPEAGNVNLLFFVIFGLGVGSAVRGHIILLCNKGVLRYNHELIIGTVLSAVCTAVIIGGLVVLVSNA